MNVKTIFALFATTDKGKSQTLRHFAKLFLEAYPKARIIYSTDKAIQEKGDFRLVVKTGNVTVGINTAGDDPAPFKKEFIELTEKYDCNVIVCATRTRGGTADTIHDFADKNRHVEVIWSSPYQTNSNDEEIQQQRNKIKAKHILDLLQEINAL